MDMDPDTDIQTEEFVRMMERPGELRGEIYGERKVVVRLLGLKFGPLTDDIVARVFDADFPLLHELEEKLLVANSIDEVFASCK